MVTCVEENSESDSPLLAVIVSKQRITGPSNGSSAYLLSVAQSLVDAGYAVDLVQPSPAIAGRTPFLRLSPEMEIFRKHAIRGAWKIGPFRIFTDLTIWMHAAIGVFRMLGRKLGVRGSWVQDRKSPYAVATPWKQEDLAFLRKRIPREATVVIADYIFCAEAVQQAANNASTAILMHDLFHIREGDGEDSVAMIDKGEEIARLAMADAVFAIQESERSFVETNVQGPEAILVPMPVRTVDSPQPGIGDRLLFVGSDTAPNVVGLRWFLENVWPAVHNELPTMVLEVAGSVSRAFEGRIPEGVRFLGMIADLEPLYRHAGIVISPLTFGSGLKIKLVEALARGKAMVVTGITLQGVESLCQGAVRQANEAPAFAAQILDLARNDQERSELARCALDCANAHFEVARAHEELRRWLKAQATRSVNKTRLTRKDTGTSSLRSYPGSGECWGRPPPRQTNPSQTRAERQGNHQD